MPENQDMNPSLHTLNFFFNKLEIYSFNRAMETERNKLSKTHCKTKKVIRQIILKITRGKPSKYYTLNAQNCNLMKGEKTNKEVANTYCTCK